MLRKSLSLNPSHLFRHHAAPALAARALTLAPMAQPASIWLAASRYQPTAALKKELHHTCNEHCCHSKRPFSTAAGDAAAAGTSQQAEAAIGSDIPGAKRGDELLVFVFTCTKCETRSARTMTKVAYFHGTVLVKCPGCKNLHLIADKKRYFHDTDFDVAALLEERGETVRRVGSMANNAAGNSGAASGATAAAPALRLKPAGPKLVEMPGDPFTFELTAEDAAVLSSGSKSVNLKTGEEVQGGYAPGKSMLDDTPFKTGAKGSSSGAEAGEGKQQQDVEQKKVQ